MVPFRLLYWYVVKSSFLRRPIILFAVGAILGIGFYSMSIEKSNTTTTIDCVKESGTLLARVTHLTRRFPSTVVSSIIMSSKPLFLDAPTASTTGTSLLEHKTYYMPCGKNCHAFCRALRSLGWTKLNSVEDAQLVFTDMMNPSLEQQLKPHQRYNHMPSRQYFTSDKQFWETIVTYRRTTDAAALPFIPDTYRLDNLSERQSLERILLDKKQERKSNWVVWQNQGTISHIVKSKTLLQQILPKTSSPQYKKMHYTVSRYICNQMTWTDGNPFLIRVYWLVASVDPLLVFYQDGFVRIGYNQTNPHILKNDVNVVTMEELETYIEATKKRRRRRNDDDFDAISPMIHIRNQIKASLVQLVDVFSKKSFQPSKNREDGFELFCTDFILTDDDDYTVSLWNSPYSDTMHGVAYSMSLEDYYWLLEKNHDLFYSTMTIITELWKKQLLLTSSYNKGTVVSYLPFENTGTYQLIYVKNTAAAVMDTTSTSTSTNNTTNHQKEEVTSSSNWKFQYNHLPNKKKNHKHNNNCKVIYTKEASTINYYNNNIRTNKMKRSNKKKLISTSSSSSFFHTNKVEEEEDEEEEEEHDTNNWEPI